MIVLRECRLGALLGLAVSLGACGVEGESDLGEAVGTGLPQAGAAGSSTGAAGSPGGEVGGAGAPASGGSSGGGSAAASAAPAEVVAFAGGLDGFRINYYCSGNPPACVSVMDAVAEAGADAGAGDAGEAAPPPSNDFVEAVFDPAVGEPEPGSARITLQFSADGQLADFARNFGDGTTPGLDLTGKVLTARARVAAGGPPTVVAKLYIKTGMTYSYADSGETPLLPDVWTQLRYQTPSYVNDIALYDITDVREVGIEILGRGATAPTTTVVHIDTIEL